MKCRQSTPDSELGSPCLSGMVSKRLEFSLVLPLLLVMQWLHILAGITWFGGYLVLDVVLWPTVLRLPVKQAKMTSDLIGKCAGPVMATRPKVVSSSFYLGIHLTSLQLKRHAPNSRRHCGGQEPVPVKRLRKPLPKHYSPSPRSQRIGGFSIASISFLARIEELIWLNVLARRCSATLLTRGEARG
jgi:hypothetical protein